MSSYTAIANRETFDFKQFAKDDYINGERYLKNYVAGSKHPGSDTEKGEIRENLYYLHLLQLTPGLGFIKGSRIFENETDIINELKKIVLVLDRNIEKNPMKN